MKRGGSSRLWLLPVPITVVLMAVYYFVPSQVAAAISFAGAQWLWVGAVAVGILMYHPAHARGWWTIGLGLALVATATAMTVAVPFDGVTLAGPSIADGLDLGGDLLIVAGLLALTQASLGGGARGGLLDAGIITLGAALLAWVFWMDPLTETGGTTMTQLISAVAHPAVDVLWFGLVARLVFARGQRSTAFWLITAALPCAFIGDAAFALAESAEGFQAGSFSDIGWWLFTAAFAMAALHPSMVQPIRTLGVAVDRPTRLRLFLLLGALLLVPAVITFQMFTEPNDRAILEVAVVVAAGMAALVVARLGGIVVSLRASLDMQGMMQTELSRQALHDGLTGLPNRNNFLVRLDRALADGERFAVLFCDLDDLKVVNDTQGHSVGDAVLVAFAGRIQGLIRPVDLAARLGGDEFAVLLRDVDASAAKAVADRIAAGLRMPLEAEGRTIAVQASIGIASSDDSVHDAPGLMRNADIAMYLAKSDGKGRAEVFRPEMHAHLVRRLAARAELDAAIIAGEFVVHYQPVVDLRTRRLESVEALVRWQHPTRGLLQPSEFIETAESTGLIVPLGSWILEEACRQAVAWNRVGEPQPLPMAVNVSARQLREPGFVDVVQDALRSTGLDPTRLILELTETVLTDPTVTESVLARLRRLGVRIAIDDFGTGYSSLSYLRTYPVDIIKIDRSFVTELVAGGRQSKVTEMVIGLAVQLELEIIAEGIEVPEQVTSLVQLGCRLGQGYLFARPLPAVALSALVARRDMPVEATKALDTRPLGKRQVMALEGIA